MIGGTSAGGDDYFPREKVAAESQIRTLDIRSEEKILTHLKTLEISSGGISNPHTPSVSEEPIFNIIPLGNKTWLSIDTKRTFLLKTLATERNRVLRN